MRYPKECILKDCEEAVIRPLKSDDESLLNRFYENIPEDDRWCMRYDITKPETVHKWITNMDSGTVFSIIALCNNEIIGHGSLHFREFGATKHVGRFRIVVIPEFRNKRLGTWILLDLIQAAMDKGLKTLRTDLVSGIEDAAIEAVKKFDFFQRAQIKNYAIGPNGNNHDMVIMIKRLHANWTDY